MNEYKRFAVATLDQTERTTDVADKMGVLIMAEAWPCSRNHSARS
jgi:hypothetical protein